MDLFIVLLFTKELRKNVCISFSKRAIHIDIVAFSSVDNDYAFVLKNIWVLGVSLYLCYLDDIFQQDVMEVWLMNEHGISESWTGIAVLEDKSNFADHRRLLAAMKIFGNGDVFLLCQPYVYLYNPETVIEFNQLQLPLITIPASPLALKDLVRDKLRFQ
ncbi:hypothetical protein NC651_022818 [Populus alba x Populus x berolinensis]|nr:hypothetical protein NC651_022818 [Populus alba x Populus x berolinensis]